MSKPLPVNAKNVNSESSNNGLDASYHINENVLASSLRAESIARLGTSPLPSNHHLSTSPNNNHGDNLSVDMPDEEVAKAVKRHLVAGSISPSTSRVSSRRSYNHRQEEEEDEEGDEVTDFHQLKGGAITHDIYKWSEDQEQKKKNMKRSKSMMVAKHAPSDPALLNLKDPGGFRRHYIIDRAHKKGKKPPSWITHSFVDFLAMYGHFGGEDLSDDEGLSSDDEEEEAGEHTSLIRRQSATSTEGTATPTKAVFLLLKSFIGTGVMFLPKA